MSGEVRKRKILTWADVARMVLGDHEALSVNDIFKRIQERGLRETTPGSKECLFSMMRAHSRGQHSLFYRRLNKDRTICFGLRSDLPPTTEIAETDADTDDESQKYDSRFKPKVQLLKMGNEAIETENVAPDCNHQLPLKRKSTTINTTTNEEPTPKRCLRPKPQRTLDERLSSTSSEVSQSSSSNESKSPSSDQEPIHDDPIIALIPSLTKGSRKGFQTMREMLNVISESCSIKTNRRPSKKSSIAQQLEDWKRGFIDLENPDSLLINVSIKELLSPLSFASLPKSYQHKLIALLPPVDRKLSGSIESALNNEFFASACYEFKERLMDGDLAPENQTRQRSEYEKRFKSVDSWKRLNFEEVWGQKLLETSEDIKNYQRLQQEHRARVEASQKQEDEAIEPDPPPVEPDKLKKEETKRTLMLSPVAAASSSIVSTSPSLQTPEENSDKEDELIQQEAAKMALFLPSYSSTLHQVMAEYGLPVSSNHRRKCNNLVPASLCHSAKRVGLSLYPPSKSFLGAPVSLPRRRLRYFQSKAGRGQLEEAIKNETQRRFDKECSFLEEHLRNAKNYLEDPSYAASAAPVPLDVQSVINDILNHVDSDRIHEYNSLSSYATSTIGSPSHGGTTIDENFGSELMFSVATDEEPPTDMSDTESRPQTAIDNDNSFVNHDDEYVDETTVAAAPMLSEDDTREAITPDAAKSDRNPSEISDNDVEIEEQISISENPVIESEEEEEDFDDKPNSDMAMDTEEEEQDDEDEEDEDDEAQAKQERPRDRRHEIQDEIVEDDDENVVISFNFEEPDDTEGEDEVIIQGEQFESTVIDFEDQKSKSEQSDSTRDVDDSDENVPSTSGQHEVINGNGTVSDNELEDEDEDGSPDCVILDEEDFQSDQSNSPEILSTDSLSVTVKSCVENPIDVQPNYDINCDDPIEKGRSFYEYDEIGIGDLTGEPSFINSGLKEDNTIEESKPFDGEALIDSRSPLEIASNGRVACLKDGKKPALPDQGNLNSLPKEEGEPSGERDDNGVAESDSTLSDEDTDIDTSMVDDIEENHSTDCEIISDSTTSTVVEDLDFLPLSPGVRRETLRFSRSNQKRSCSHHLISNGAVGTTDLSAVASRAPPKLDANAQPDAVVQSEFVFCSGHISNGQDQSNNDDPNPIKRRRKALTCRELLLATELRKQAQQNNRVTCCCVWHARCDASTASGGKCLCSLQPLLTCKRCGSYWHLKCIGPLRICPSCLSVPR